MRKIYNILIQIILLNSVIYAQAFDAGYPFINNYSPRDYKAEQDNWDIVQDQKGLIYIANSTGIIEFDGVYWEVIKVGEDQHVHSLAIDSTNKIFVGSINDFGYLAIDENGKHRFVSLRYLLPSQNIRFNEIWRIAINSDGVYFQASEYLFRYYNERISVFKPNSEFDFLHLCDSKMFVQDSSIGLLAVLKDSLHLFPLQTQFKSEIIAKILPLEGDSLLVCTDEKIYHVYHNNVTQFKTEADVFFIQTGIYDALKTDEGNFLIATFGNGIITINKHGKIISHLNKSNGLSCEQVNKIFLDKEGNLWSANIIGISKIQLNSSVRKFDSRSGLNSLSMALEKHNGKLYSATLKGAYEFDYISGRFSHIQGSNEDFLALLSVGDDLLLGGMNGAFVYRDDQLTEISGAYPGYFLRSKLDTNLVYSSDFGLRKFYKDNGKWIDKGLVKGIMESTYGLFENPDGSLWIQTENSGFIKLENINNSVPTVKRYGTDQGLPSSKLFGIKEIENDIKFLTSKGIYKYSNEFDLFVYDTAFCGRFIPQSPKGCKNINVDESGNLWIINSINGMNTVHYFQKTNENKYEEVQTSASLLNDYNISLAKTFNNGEVWFANEDGLFLFDLKREKTNNPLFTTRISKVILSDIDSVIYGGDSSLRDKRETDSTDELKTYKLIYPHNSIKFCFAGLSFSGVDNEFSYYLKGQEDNWLGWTKQSSKEYTNLPGGEYTFYVRAKNIYNNIGTLASFSFIVHPPWWNTFWFLGFVILLALTSMYIGINRIYKHRIKNLEKEENERKEFSRQLIESQELERKRISSELHDSLGQNLIIIKNLLNMSLNNKLKNEEVRVRISEISDITSRSIEEARTIASNLHPYQLSRMGLAKAIKAMVRELETSTMLTIESFVELENSILTKEIEAHIYRIIQETLNNAVKHAEADKLCLELYQDNALIKLVISDNGKGFSREDVKIKVDNYKGGYGLFGIEERARIIGAKLNIISSQNKGTTIELDIPVGEN